MRAMPTTRTRSHATTAVLQDIGNTTVANPPRVKVTRSGQTRDLADGLQDDPNPRSPKRRRTASHSSPSPQLPVVLQQDAPLEVVPSTNLLDVERAATNGSNGLSVSLAQQSSLPQQPVMPAPDGRVNAQEHNGAQMGSSLRLSSLPILENLSTQLLVTHAKFTHQETIAYLADPSSENSRAYSAIKSLFEHTKRVYTNSVFLDAYELGLHEPSQVDIIRRVNLATFICGVFAANMDLAELDRNFLRIFVPENGRLLKAQGSLLLELKTQAFISCAHVSDVRTMLSRLFPEDMEMQVLRRRPGARALAPSEQDFLKRLHSRRDFLTAEINTQNIQALPEKYTYDGFLRETSAYVSKNIDSMTTPADGSISQAGMFVNMTPTQTLQQVQMEGNFSIIPSLPPLSAPTTDPSPPLSVDFTPAPVPVTPVIIGPPVEDFVAKAARAAQIALQSQGMSWAYASPQPVATPPPPPPAPPKQLAAPSYQQVQPTFQHYTPPTNTSTQSKPSQAPSPNPSSELPHVSQSAPTQVLYERARMATTAKASPNNRKTSTPSQRRPWTTEEENALMAGLDRVRGAHWSQILGMFGPGGTINESLKDRNQVQLKDKARNLKLFFLKSGIEVPYYLKYVTGDLKSRAPTQALKREARERERQQGEADKAHLDGVQGIIALSGAQAQAANMPQSRPGIDGHYQVLEAPLPEALSPDAEMDSMTSMDGDVKSGETRASQELDPTLEANQA